MTDTYSQSTLHLKSQAFDDFDADVKAAVEYYQNLSANQKARYVDYLTKVFNDSPWVRNLARKGKDIAEENDWPSVAEFLSSQEDELELILDEQANLTPEFKEKATQLFFRAVDAKIFHSQPLMRTINEFIAEWHMTPWISDEELDAVELLANNIRRLEECLEEVAEEKQRLLGEIEEIQQRGNLHEETGAGFYQTSPNKKVKHSTIDEYLLQPTEDFDETEQQRVGDFRMRQYLEQFR
jgi:hypothetical protein